jgi:RNA polymerase sigma-70 factor (ECF subfamily)
MPDLSSNAASARRSRFAAIARENEPVLMRTALRLCQGDPDRSADLVQDALVRAYQSYADGGFQDGTNVKAWLLRILTNAFINEYRRKKRWDAGIDVDTLTASGESGPESTHAAPADVPGTALFECLLDEELERALAALSPLLRSCVVLVDIEGLEYAEAALSLGIPIGTVRSRLARARMQMHDLLMDFARRRGLVGRTPHGGAA